MQKLRENEQQRKYAKKIIIKYTFIRDKDMCVLKKREILIFCFSRCWYLNNVVLCLLLYRFMNDLNKLKTSEMMI